MYIPTDANELFIFPLWLLCSERHAFIKVMLLIKQKPQTIIDIVFKITLKLRFFKLFDDLVFQSSIKNYSFR